MITLQQGHYEIHDEVRKNDKVEEVRKNDKVEEVRKNNKVIV